MKLALKRLLAWPFIAPIRLYQRWISPFTPSMCRFRPTCSQYTVEAIGHRGVVKGILLATWRIMRCNPFNAGGWDPVPGTPEAEYRDRCLERSAQAKEGLHSHHPQQEHDCHGEQEN